MYHRDRQRPETNDDQRMASSRRTNHYVDVLKFFPGLEETALRMRNHRFGFFQDFVLEIKEISDCSNLPFDTYRFLHVVFVATFTGHLRHSTSFVITFFLVGKIFFPGSKDAVHRERVCRSGSLAYRLATPVLIFRSFNLSAIGSERVTCSKSKIQSQIKLLHNGE